MNTLAPYAMSTTDQEPAVEPDVEEFFVALQRLGQLAQAIEAGEALPVTLRWCPSDEPAAPGLATSQRSECADALGTVMFMACRLLFVAMATIGVGVTALQFAPHPARPTLMPSGIAVPLR